MSWRAGTGVVACALILPAAAGCGAARVAAPATAELQAGTPSPSLAPTATPTPTVTATPSASLGTPSDSAMPSTNAVTSSSVPSAGAATSAIALCTSSNLKTLTANQGSYQGTVAYSVDLQNVGTSPCGLTNKVAVVGVTRSGKTQTGFARVLTQAPDPLPVASGQGAHIFLIENTSCSGIDVGTQPDNEFSLLTLTTDDGRSYTLKDPAISDYCGPIKVGPWTPDAPLS